MGGGGLLRRLIISCVGARSFRCIGARSFSSVGRSRGNVLIDCRSGSKEGFVAKIFTRSIPLKHLK